MAPLMPGMLTSNEPGVYLADRYGIRCENLVLTIPYETTEFGNFYAFETEIGRASCRERVFVDV